MGASKWTCMSTHSTILGVTLICIGSSGCIYGIERGNLYALIGGFKTTFIGFPLAIFSAIPTDPSIHPDWLRIWCLLGLAIPAAVFGYLHAKPIRYSRPFPFLASGTVIAISFLLILYPSLSNTHSF
ncbi:hypothetical protein COU17_00120 [Candidatus Kaiserbacteria bacterium CG10_big_fil_rev_8_21_14_0_10_49_17]|uniref:Uncharacterized protein n=1 Tax=Candidatus Kaiserbacteria bacterium CG10_big_fil_rev_8_21_14_0_10_49_17 TaxID=1974609 RepID=A0A2M6WF30_9BACT|nr:MAG: hypothetical protein COU17_00120 [Candidatus Kaiserbacteria bacterium CG10_big_fil_rev_8_21_14_0_10_49_17]